MLITNYSFFSAILDQKFFSPSRWHFEDETDYPSKDNKYFVSYKNLLINLITENNVAVIYIISPLESNYIYDYISQDCFEEIFVFNQLKSYELKNCNEINY